MNSELAKVIAMHYKKYPEMQAADFVKLLYQNEFGGKHMALERQKSLNALSSERRLGALAGHTATSFEYIGNNYFRMYFSVNGSHEISDNTLNGLFMVSSEHANGSRKNFNLKLQLLENLCKKKLLLFPYAKISDYIEKYRQAGSGPVPHSKIYRDKYHPAYRVINRYCYNFFHLFAVIDRMLSEKKKVAVALEGGCCSGKTTLAALLKSVYDCNIIHMDDFFLPRKLRTPLRFSETDGNIDYERFSREVSPYIKAGIPFSFGKYSCLTDTIVKYENAAVKNLYIVEGVYSMHPRLNMDYDITVFLHITPEEQAKRVSAREPPEKCKLFFNQWIPKENLYFKTFRPEKKCMLHFYSK